jgi:prepilin-type N-terminal cleavage/methylation domain-containing protein
MTMQKQFIRKQDAARGGFTLIELLVVMAIIALLASLLLPAVQSVRESGRRTQCLSQLHNIAIAMHNYQGVYKTLPSGWISPSAQSFGPVVPGGGVAPPVPAVPLCNVQLSISSPIQIPLSNGQKTNLTDFSISQYWGWQAMLTPYIEEKNLTPDWIQPKYVPGQATISPSSNWGKMTQEIGVYVCPSAVVPANRPNGLGYSTYRANLGYWSVAQSQAAAAAGLPPPYNGPLYENSNCDFDRDISDGTTHTLLVGDSTYGFWGDGYSCCARFRDDYSTPSYFDHMWPGSDPCGNVPYYFFGFGSAHGELFNAAMADGREVSIPKNTDVLVLQAIATRNGGETQRLD